MKNFKYLNIFYNFTLYSNVQFNFFVIKKYFIKKNLIRFNKVVKKKGSKKQLRIMKKVLDFSINEFPILVKFNLRFQQS